MIQTRDSGSTRGEPMPKLEPDQDYLLERVRHALDIEFDMGSPVTIIYDADHGDDVVMVEHNGNDFDPNDRGPMTFICVVKP
jgi:hypothetical protein